MKLLYGVSDISDRTQQPKSANLVFAHSGRNKVITIDSKPKKADCVKKPKKYNNNTRYAHCT